MANEYTDYFGTDADETLINAAKTRADSLYLSGSTIKQIVSTLVLEYPSLKLIHITSISENAALDIPD